MPNPQAASGHAQAVERHLAAPGTKSEAERLDDVADHTPPSLDLDDVHPKLRNRVAERRAKGKPAAR